MGWVGDIYTYTYTYAHAHVHVHRYAQLQTTDAPPQGELRHTCSAGSGLVHVNVILGQDQIRKVQL